MDGARVLREKGWKKQRPLHWVSLRTSIEREGRERASCTSKYQPLNHLKKPHLPTLSYHPLSSKLDNKSNYHHKKRKPAKLGC